MCNMSCLSNRAKKGSGFVEYTTSGKQKALLQVPSPQNEGTYTAASNNANNELTLSNCEPAMQGNGLDEKHIIPERWSTGYILLCRPSITCTFTEDQKKSIFLKNVLLVRIKKGRYT